MKEGGTTKIQLCIISTKVETESMVVDCLTKGEYVYGEKEGSKHRALRHTSFDWTSRWVAT